MKLLTKELLNMFPPLYANENKKPEEVKVIAKFFNPTGVGNWYATEYRPEERLFFGYACLGDKRTWPNSDTSVSTNWRSSRASWGWVSNVICISDSITPSPKL